MFNGPLRGSNTSADQNAYDIIFKDIIVNSNLGTPNSAKDTFTYNLSTDNLNQIYKAELISATVKFNTSIQSNVQNQSLILSIQQLNGNTVRIAGNTIAGNSNQGNNTVQGNIFCQIPENCTPITPGGLTPNNIISLLIGARVYESIQFYNPPINRLNQLDIQWYDNLGNIIPIHSSTSGTINTFYFTIRIYYFQKRNNTTAFSIPILNYPASGTQDSIFQPMIR
jgi:hypothetical protein